MSDSAPFFIFAAGFLAGSSATLFASVLSTKGDVAPARVLSSLPKSQKHELKRVSIDESTFVTKVDDDSLRSSGVTLGTVTTSQDDINAASSKLLQLKKTKG